MDTFTDYYAVLGVDADTSASNIKAAFKKLALQYHPDVYKGEDAQERMRILLLAYQTLSDPTERKIYDAHRSEHVMGTFTPRRNIYNAPPDTQKHNNKGEVSPTARRDRQRHYAFPDLNDTRPHIDLSNMTYDLSPAEARTLQDQGMLRGVAFTTSYTGAGTRTSSNNYPFHCHRCHHHWTPTSSRNRSQADTCPSCKSRDWSEYLLLRCTHCHAVFESEQIRDEVGSYNYGDGALCPPYELFPLCPYCNASGWCPVEDARVHVLRARADRRAALTHLIWFGLTIMLVIVLSVVAITVLR
ncbi:MAG: hypothetical protein NVS4B7_01980 [Ktedonobacteraceae bacterium]